jgi:hypothetical protein
MKEIVRQIVSYTLAIMAIGLVTEFFFRMINNFSKESRIFFHWMYVIGLSIVVIGGGILGWKLIRFALTSTPEGVMFCLMVVIAGLIGFYMMNLKEE